MTRFHSQGDQRAMHRHRALMRTLAPNWDPKHNMRTEAVGANKCGGCGMCRGIRYEERLARRRERYRGRREAQIALSDG